MSTEQTDTNLLEIVLNSLELNTNLSQNKDYHIELIAGDASDRKFYRLQFAQNSIICMKFTKWGEAFGGSPLNWLKMQSALSKINIPVPKVLKISEKNLCIWLEDFGNNFLTSFFKGEEIDLEILQSIHTICYYHEAIDLILKLQYPEKNMPDNPAKYSAFDEEKLTYELNFFIKHFLIGLLSISNDDKNIKLMKLKDEFSALSYYLATRERIICHRDYHSRNLMIVNDNVKWIDFQDAKMGPHSYDLVSLIRDPYVSITSQTKTHLYCYYYDLLCSARERYKLKTITWHAFNNEVLHSGLQRNIKALGSFAYLYLEKNKKTYLKYVKNSLKILTAQDSIIYESTDLRTIYPEIYKLIYNLKSGIFADKLNNLINNNL